MTLLDSPSVPTIAPADRSQRLLEAGSGWQQRIAASPAAAQLRYRVQGDGIGSVATRLTVGKHELLVDEPAALAGDDVAASPVEVALGALIACQVVVYRLYAEVLEIPIDDISITAVGDLDARRLFGIDEGVRAGFGSVQLDIVVTGPESAERYEELKAAVDAHCPVLDLFANPTPVTASIRKA